MEHHSHTDAVKAENSRLEQYLEPCGETEQGNVCRSAAAEPGMASYTANNSKTSEVGEEAQCKTMIFFQFQKQTA